MLVFQGVYHIFKRGVVQPPTRKISWTSSQVTWNDNPNSRSRGFSPYEKVELNIPKRVANGRTWKWTCIILLPHFWPHQQGCSSRATRNTANGTLVWPDHAAHPMFGSICHGVGWVFFTWAMKKGPWLFGLYTGWWTTQLYRDYNKPLRIRIPTNQPV